VARRRPTRAVTKGLQIFAVTWAWRAEHLVGVHVRTWESLVTRAAGRRLPDHGLAYQVFSTEREALAFWLAQFGRRPVIHRD
jgi:hypothetical protein